MVFSFARVDDVYAQHRRLWVRLREKSGNWHEMPCHHTLEAYLHAYPAGASIADEPKGLLFRKVQRDRHHRLSEKWWHAGERDGDCRSRFDTDHAEVRSSPVSTSVSTRSNAHL